MEYTEREETVALESRVSPFITMTMGEVGRIMGVGAIVGLVVSGLMYLLTTFVLANLLCRNQALPCTTAPMYAMIIAMVVGGMVGLAALARMRVYRPLLVVLAVTIGLWAYHVMLAGIVWYLAIVISIMFFALAYGLFAWVARARSLIVVVVLTLLLIVALRVAIG